METGKIADDIHSLKQSLESMGKHISALSADAFTEGKTQSKQVAQETLQRLESEFGVLRKKLGTMGQDVAGRAKELDDVVRKKPYWFLAGAAGIGYLLGKTHKRH